MDLVRTLLVLGSRVCLITLVAAVVCLSGRIFALAYNLVRTDVLDLLFNWATLVSIQSIVALGVLLFLQEYIDNHWPDKPTDPES
jgi:hypothetical protein